jgi:hypothetical protein
MLIRQLRAWCKASHGRQKDLAGRLEVSPQLVNDWLSGHRTVGLDEWTKIEPIIRSTEPQFQKDRTMSTRVFNPDRLRSTSSDDDDEPLDHLTGEPNTLYEACEMIDALRAELKSKPAAAAITPASQLVLPTPTPKPAVELPAASTPTTAWEKEVLRAHQAATADLSSEPLEKQSIPQLRAALNAEKDPARRTVIYRQLKQVERDAKLVNPRARLRSV